MKRKKPEKWRAEREQTIPLRQFSDLITSEEYERMINYKTDPTKSVFKSTPIARIKQQ
jgi:hypothetical protein